MTTDEQALDALAARVRAAEDNAQGDVVDFGPEVLALIAELRGERSRGGVLLSAHLDLAVELLRLRRREGESCNAVGHRVDAKKLECSHCGALFFEARR